MKANFKYYEVWQFARLWSDFVTSFISVTQWESKEAAEDYMKQIETLYPGRYYQQLRVPDGLPK